MVERKSLTSIPYGGILESKVVGAEARERGQGKIWRDFGYQSK